MTSIDLINIKEMFGGFPPAIVLTCSPKKEKHSDPVDPEEHEAEEGPERLQGQQGKMDEHFTSHMKQGDGEGHSFPHEKHYQQENHLWGYTKTSDLMKYTGWPKKSRNVDLTMHIGRSFPPVKYLF